MSTAKIEELKPGQRFKFPRMVDSEQQEVHDDVLSTHEFIRVWDGLTYCQEGDNVDIPVKAISLVDGRPIWFSDGTTVILL